MIITVYSRFFVNLKPIIFDFMKKAGENKNAVLLGQRIRTMRTAKGWTQEKLGEMGNINYKFLGEIERGQQNPSFNVLTKIAEALKVDLPELFRFDHESYDPKKFCDRITGFDYEMFDRKEAEVRIKKILRTIPDDDLRRLMMILHLLYPSAHK